ncbi:helitron_like_N domain-containing protein [Trichonephila inaurata madagascariensis]|uniref:Helitron_like_N domain-containing protein n=1 Tax=Trichonephila inaurata madagascariensis TaxID=2747483 RepID=A0A8X6YY69_9ARAC|nr:helitron_like_N domain-containing protein [Trichonephila inaurata madagascariensis]
MGAQIVPPAGRGAYCFRIHGQIYHRTSHLHLVQAGEKKFAQLYVLDSELATCRKMKHHKIFECNPELRCEALWRSLDESTLLQMHTKCGNWSSISSVKKNMRRRKTLQCA